MGSGRECTQHEHDIGADHCTATGGAIGQLERTVDRADTVLHGPGRRCRRHSQCHGMGGTGIGQDFSAASQHVWRPGNEAAAPVSSLANLVFLGSSTLASWLRGYPDEARREGRPGARRCCDPGIGLRPARRPVSHRWPIAATQTNLVSDRPRRPNGKQARPLSPPVRDGAGGQGRRAPGQPGEAKPRRTKPAGPRDSGPCRVSVATGAMLLICRRLLGRLGCNRTKPRVGSQQE